jgi:hypothetical protein
MTWGPDDPLEGRLVPPTSGLYDLWEIGPLTAEERREQDERFRLMRIGMSSAPGWGIWDEAYKRLVWWSTRRWEAEEEVEKFRVSCALWEERIARGSTKEETEELVTALSLSLHRRKDSVRLDWLTVLRTDELDAELHLEVFLADAQRARRRASAFQSVMLV